MQTLHGEKLAQTLRKLSDEAKSRVWIASPYIGQWQAVGALLGANWWTGSTVLLRLITDAAPENRPNLGTLRRLADRGLIRNLPALHAKVYIIDNAAIVTSANLTLAGFTKRHEVGILLEGSDATSTISIFEHWWNTLSHEVDAELMAKLSSTAVGLALADESNGPNLRALWHLPERPADDFFTTTDKSGKFSGYYRFLENYKELAEIYAQHLRIWPNADLYIEVDAFLNYLFRDAEDRPSFQHYGSNEPRKRTQAGRTREIESRANAFRDWVSQSKNDERWRETNVSIVQRILSPDAIETLTFDKAREVANCLNCMNARQLNKYKFLNPRNNAIEVIANAWRKLLFGKEKEAQRLKECDEALRYFGQSSVQELLGWYWPDRYPLRNSNSNAGLLYFGYAIV